MGNSCSTSSDSAKGEPFRGTLLYVQHVDEDKDTASETPDRYLEEILIADRYNFADFTLTQYLASPNENLSILQSSMGDRITEATVYSNPLPIPLESNVTIHAFVVFKTEPGYQEFSWWSLEKNGQHIVLQQSENKDDVINKLYDTEKGQSVKRLGPIKTEISDTVFFNNVWSLFKVIWKTNQISDPYHLLFSNCQNFASFIFEKLTGKKWSTMTSALVDRLKKKKIQPKIKVDEEKYFLFVNDETFDYYKAMIEGRREDFEKLANDLTIESLNRGYSHDFMLIEWATVFSSTDWPIKQFLEDKGAEIRSDKGLFRLNMFFIALHFVPEYEDYLPGVNGDNKALPYLYGKKREIVEKIVNQFEDDDFNTTNIVGDTPLHLAAKLNLEFGLFKQILKRTNSENVNKVNGNGETALLYAIDEKSETKVEELLKRDDVDVKVKNKDNETALHLASKWTDIPFDLFKSILEKSTDINAQDKDGKTALHYAILNFSKGFSETKVKELLNHKGVDVNVKTKYYHETPLHYASWKDDFPMDLFTKIIEKSTSDTINTQDEIGHTPLHYAIFHKSETKVKELLAHKGVDVNIENNNNETALHLASNWKNIPSDLFKLISERSANEAPSALTVRKKSNCSGEL